MTDVPSPARLLPPGYGLIGCPITPPCSYVREPFTTTTTRQLKTIDAPTRTRAEVKQLLARHLQEERVGINPEMEMKVKSIENTVAHVYRLQSFWESRYASWSYVPDHAHDAASEPVKDSSAVSLPDPWSISVTPLRPFEDYNVIVPVPGSVSSEVCHRCAGTGALDCPACESSGLSQCHRCSRASPRRPSLKSCSGCGIKRQLICASCCGSGDLPCPTCHATGRLKYTLQLESRFHTSSNHFLSNAAGLPLHLVTRDILSTVLEETSALLRPLQVSEFADVELVGASQRLHSKQTNPPDTGSVLLLQKQEVHAFPVTVVRIKCRGKQRVMHVFGDDARVRLDKYPPFWSQLATLRLSLSP